jgi:nitrate reductase NapE
MHEPSPSAPHPDAHQAERDARRELHAFLFLTIFLAPLVAVAVVGAYGLAIWLMQILTGPPTG